MFHSLSYEPLYSRAQRPPAPLRALRCDEKMKSPAGSGVLLGLGTHREIERDREREREEKKKLYIYKVAPEKI